MASWVRYSVAAYIGMLMAGSVLAPPPAPLAPASLRFVQVPEDWRPAELVGPGGETPRLLSDDDPAKTLRRG